MSIKVLLFASSAEVGLTYHLSSLAVNLKNSGNPIIVISSPGEQIPGLSTLLDKNHIPRLICPSFDKQSLGDIIRSICFLKKVIKKHKIDAIHTQGVLGAFEAYLAGICAHKKIAIVTSIHFIPVSPSRFNWLAFISMLNHCSDLVLPVSFFTGNALSKHGLKPKKQIVLHNAVDLKKFDAAAELPNPIRRTDSNITILCVGNLSPIKGQNYLLLAAAKILKKHKAKATFYFVGNGVSEESLKKLAIDLEIKEHIVFTGRISWPDIYSVIANLADICVSPSVSENFPFYLLECMAASKPIVATKVGGIAEALVDGFNGYLVEPKNADELADKILYLINNPECRINLGLSARVTFEQKFNTTTYIKKLNECYQKAYLMKVFP